MSPIFDNTKFKQGSIVFSVLTRDVRRAIPGGNWRKGGFIPLSAAEDGGLRISSHPVVFYPSGTGKNLSYDGVNTDYWVVKGELYNDVTSVGGYHAVRFDRDKQQIELVTDPVFDQGKKRQYEAQQDAAGAFYNPKVSAALAEAQGSAGEKELKKWWSDYDQQQEKYDAVEKKGAYNFMNLTSGIQMKILKKHSDEYGTDSLQDVLYSLYSQDGTALFSYGAYVGPEVMERKGDDENRFSKRTQAMIDAVNEADISLPSPELDSELFYDVAYVNYDKKSKKVGPELKWSARINSIDAFGGPAGNRLGVGIEAAVLSSNSSRYIPKNTRDNPVKFNAKSTFQFSRSYLIDVGTKKKQRVTYKSRKAGDGLVIWKNKDVAKKAATVARSKGYLMRTVPVADGWVNLAAKRKNYPDWHPLYSKTNKNLIASGKLPKNLRDYHYRQ